MSSLEQKREELNTADSRIRYKRLDCPFDLSEILQISYSSKGLQNVLEFIMDHLGQMKEVQDSTTENMNQM